jgi:tetratricopeptide (TPR) repeat protein
MPAPKPQGKTTESQEANPAGQPATAAPRWARLGAALRFLWPVLCLFQFGMLAGWWMVSQPTEGTPAAEATESGKRASLPDSAPAQVHQSTPNIEQPDPGLGEKYLGESNYALALQHLMPVNMEAKSALADTMQFRIALCLEGLGRLEEALAAYRAVVAKTTSLRKAAAAQTAQARIQLRQNHTVEAKTLLYPILLQAGHPGRFDPAMLAEARYLLAISLSHEAFTDHRLSALDEPLVHLSQASWPIVHSLDWLTSVAEARRRITQLPTTMEVLQAYGSGNEEVLLRGSVPQTSLRTLVEKLGSLGKLRVEWSLLAWQRTDDRMAQLAVDGVPLLELIEALVEPQGLLCKLQDGNLKVVTEAEMTTEAAAAIHTAAARRALRTAVFADPSHPLGAMACLELGNDEAALGKLDEAVAWYERLLAETERAPQVVAAYFNLGLVQRARKDFAASRKALYRIVDGQPGHELAYRAYVQIGWTYLLEGQPSAAVFPLRRALGIAPAARARAEAALTLAATFLLMGNPREANAVLVSGQPQVHQDSYRTTAAFLDALARFRVAAEGKNSRQEAADLLAALLAFQKTPMLGAHGQLLAGQAYKELGMSQPMAKAYERALPAAFGLVADEMMFGLADCLATEGKREAAQKWFQTLATSPKGQWTLTARYRLAALALQGGQPQQCVQACAQLLQEEGPVDRAAVFQLMGTAYEQLGDFRRAARCFAGQAPN